MLFFLLSFLLSFALSSLILFFLVPVLGNNLIDLPNRRSSHIQPTPSGGGLVFLIVSTLSFFLLCLFDHFSVIAALPLIVLPLGLIGFIDDKYSLSPVFRFTAQLLTSFILVAVSPLIQPYYLSFLQGNFLILFVFLFIILSVTAIINFTNFMDGLDGLVPGCMLVIFSALSISYFPSFTVWILVGSIFAFLFWNWSPASVFMGDAGSTFLGSLYAAFVLQASDWSATLSILLISTPIIADSFFCVLRRFLARQPLTQAHRLHLFQRLNQAGFSHSRVSAIYIAATIILALANFIGGLPWLLGLVITETLIGVWLDQRVAVPFQVASMR